MKRFAVFASLFLLTAHLSAVPAAAADTRTPVQRNGWLRVEGNKLLNEHGDPVQLRGMSYFWSMAGESQNYYNASVVGWLASDWKVSVVRAAMGIDENWGATSSGYLAGNKSGSVGNDKRVTDVVDAAIDNGIYAIIDWHSHKAHQNTDEAKAFFTEMANKYKDNPNVIYEIYNEPDIGCGTPTQSTSAWNTIKPYLQEVTNAIRQVDTKNLIILGTPCYSQQVGIATNDPITGNNLLYSLHFYSNDERHQALRGIASTAINNNKAIFVSEFGTCNSNGGTECKPGTSGDNCPKQNDNSHNPTETDVWFNFLDQHKISWVNWSISTKDEAASAIKSGTSTSGNWNDNNLTPSGAYIRGKLRAAYDAEQTTSAQTTARVIPQPQSSGGRSAIAPVSGASSSNFSAGPVPADRSGGGVKFYWWGKALKSGSLAVYNTVGSSVKSIVINDVSANALSKRAIATWDLADANGRPAAIGTYLVKGKLTASDGTVVNVSAIIGVR
jgi:endoglucanase